MEYEEKKIKLTDPKIALEKAKHYCAYQERCQQEVRDKLYSWSLWKDLVEDIIVQLINENFLNEERFAKLFAGGKFRIKKWGKIKITNELKQRNISDYCIRAALKEIDESSYRSELKKILNAQVKKQKGVRAERKKYVAARYAFSRGYESALVWELLGKNNE